MKVKKDSILKIRHTRKGLFDAKATEDFDTETDEWYPVQAITFVEGLSTDYEPGESVPCKSSFCHVTIVK